MGSATEGGTSPNQSDSRSIRSPPAWRNPVRLAPPLSGGQLFPLPPPHRQVSLTHYSEIRTAPCLGRSNRQCPRLEISLQIMALSSSVTRHFWERRQKRAGGDPGPFLAGYPHSPLP